MKPTDKFLGSLVSIVLYSIASKNFVILIKYFKKAPHAKPQIPSRKTWCRYFASFAVRLSESASGMTLCDN
jgi:hypothetical protein